MTEIDPTLKPKAKSKGGRPKLTDRTAIKKTTLGVRLNATELEQLTDRASAMGMKPTQFLRETALARRLPSPPVPAINIEEYARLARLTANLNQQTKVANATGRTAELELLQDLLSEVQALRKALLGMG
jgi:hypothetical protein